MLGQTIAAIATPPGAGGIGIIRISGAEALTVLRAVFTPYKQRPGGFLPRYLYLGQVRDAAGAPLDEALAVFMPSPHSYTGEDVAELQCHGGYVVCREILAAVFAAGAQPAEPGEFTARAFINGKLSLDQAEAVIDIIEAKSAKSLQISERQLKGGLKRKIAAAADELLNMLAELELLIDYPEEHEEAAPANAFAPRLTALLAQTDELLAQAEEGRMFREGALVAIIGPANAGKSTLLNTLLEADRAIVTAIPGTTRDTIEEYYVLDGLPLKLVDTAGIRETEDIVEKAGIERSRAALADADLVLLLLDAAELPDDFWQGLIRENAERPLLILLNKAEVCPPEVLAGQKAALQKIAPRVRVLEISAKEGMGLAALKQEISRLLLADGSAEPLCGLINERQRSALLTARQAISEALAHTAAFDADMLSVDLQTAWQALAEISGEAAADDIIERVFSRFCLGK